MKNQVFQKRLSLVTVLLLLLGALAVALGAVQAQEAEWSSLMEPGPHDVYHTDVTFVDENRGDRSLRTWIWYPAYTAQGTPVYEGLSLLENVPPDRSGAPYPLIIYSHRWTRSPHQFEVVAEHLASYGYVVAGPRHDDVRPAHAYVDRPLDIMTVLNGLSSIVDGDLAGMIDTGNVGLAGWELGGATALQMIGLMHDPVHFASWCAAHPDLATSDCWTSSDGTATATYRAQLGLEDLPDGRWQPFSDERIHAILAIAPCGFPLTTEDMLAEVSTPVMFVHGVRDDDCDYEGNAVRNYSGLTIEDRYLITLVNGGQSAGTPLVWKPFATAFFGYYLQGDEYFAAYLKEEQAEKMRDVIQDLVWGPYEGE